MHGHLLVTIKGYDTVDKGVMVILSFSLLYSCEI